MSDVVSFDDVAFAGAAASSPRISWSVATAGVHVLGVPAGMSAAIVRTCIGLIAPTAGRMRVFGAEPYRLTRRQRQRFTRQVSPWLLPPSLLSNATLRAGIELVLLHDPSWRRASARMRVHDVLAACGLEPWADARPADVPASVRIRASLARALATRPALLVADDFAARMSTDECTSLIGLCRQNAETVLIPTTAAQRLMSLADTMLELSHAAVETT